MTNGEMTLDARQDRAAAEEVFSGIANNRTQAKPLAENPASVLRAAGMQIPPGHDDAVNGLVRRLVPEYAMPDIAGSIAPAASLGCIGCKIGCYSIAAAIVAIGAGGLVLLTVESPAVVALAAFAAVDASAALAFIVGLATLGVFTVDTVVTNICDWTGACD